MDIHEVPLLEELVDSHGCQAADPEHSLEGVGSGTKMGDGAQELHAVALGLQWEIAGGGTLYGDLLGLNLEGLLGIGGQHQRTPDDQSSTDVDLGDLLKVGHGVIINHLNRGEISTVIQGNEAKLLAAPAVANPAAHGNLLIGILFRVPEEITNRNQIHCLFLFSGKNIS